MTDFTSNSFGYFIVSDGESPRNFIIKLETPERVLMAREIISGQLPTLHVQGNIIRESVSYNRGWSYHIDPGSVEFFSVGSAWCNETFAATEGNLANIGNTFLSNSRICPWSSYLVAEVEPGTVDQEFLTPQQSWSPNNNSQGITINGEHVNKIPNYYSKFSLVSGLLPDGLTLSNTGAITGNVLLSEPSLTDPLKEFSYTLALGDATVANIARSVSNIATAAGITLPNTVPNAFATVANLNSLLSAEGNIVFRTYSSSVITTRPYFLANHYQDRVFGTGNGYKYFLTTGNQTQYPGSVWRVSQGQLPPGATLSNLGELTVDFGQSILPFLRETFIKRNLPHIESLEPGFWDEWLHEYMSQSHELDYQFMIELTDVNGIAITAHTFRILHLKPPVNSEWFWTNRDHLIVDPDQYYYYVSSSESENITWTTEAGLLGNIANGEISQFGIQAIADNKEIVSIDFKPGVNNQFPHGLKLQSNGIISGRVGYRCYADDPVNLPVNDLYNFTVRAYSENYDSYAERSFSIQVNRINDAPSDNIWIRAYPYIHEREYFYSIMNNADLFPDELLYRPTDPWFGRAQDIRVLFAPGLNLVSPAAYEQILDSNHADKKLLFGDVRTAVSLNPDLTVKYEVVYLTLIDEMMTFDPITKLYNRSVASVVDLRPYITNYYIEDGVSYYILKPNSLANMKSVLDSRVGTLNNGLVPSWMTSLQPIPDRPGFFNQPPGFQPVVVLAYCVAGGSAKIARALKTVNFNEISFEFDRYQLENRLSQFYDPVSGNYQAAVTTTIDSANTTFDANSTRFVENYDGYADPEQGDKYLKFPKTRVFK